MSCVATDRNLLFGVLALQMDFVCRDELLDAMHAWVLDKGRPLGRVLVARGALEEADHSLLEAMVRRHLERHGGDAERSLAALGATRPLRDGLGLIADEGVQATLARVGSGGAPTQADGEATAAGTPRAAGARFRVLRPHARGALGQVSVALDAELHREVALKEIQPQFVDDPGSRARFLLEAEVTGRLEHPGVVPVYGLGSGADGRPFYAMRFVRGESLKEAIDAFHAADRPDRDPGERSVGLRKLLTRFLDVCNAVEYAHSRGVVHRDIKPANILLGPYGETLLVDWGLAKVVGRDEAAGAGEATLHPMSGGSGSSATVAGTAIGTPAFMSPEQAEGRLEAIGPASDVYSLGATLFALLVGRPPFEGRDLADLLGQVRRGAFPRPSEAGRGVPKALEAVCLKAMALRPGERYRSAHDLAEDVERWLADEPVSAWREPWWEHARRWASRNRTVVAALAIAAPVAIVSLGTIAAHESRTGRQLAKNGQELALALRKATAAQARSEQREQLALYAIDSYRRAVEENPDVRDRPELQPLRIKLLEAPLRFYRRLKADLEVLPDDARKVEYKEMLARANFGLAFVSALIGSEQEALRVYQEAIAIYRPLAEAPRAPEGVRSELAIAYNNLGNLQLQMGQAGEARDSHRRAYELRSALVRAAPRDAGARSALAYSLHNLGWLESRVGRSDRAIASYREALAIRRTLAAEEPDNVGERIGVAQTCNNLGFLLRATGREDEARSFLRQALGLIEPLARQWPLVGSYREVLAQTLTNLGEASRGEEARALLEQAREIREGLLRASPSRTQYATELADTLSLLGNVHRLARRFPEALEAQRRAVAVIEPFAAAHPADTEVRRTLASALNHLGLSLVDADRPAEALGPYARAIELTARLARDDAENLGTQSLLAGGYNNRGMALAKLGRHEEALSDFREAVDRERPCLDRAPEVLQYRSWLSSHLRNIARSLLALGRYDEALAESARRLDLWPDDRGLPGERARQVYNVACILALCARPDGPAHPDEARLRAYADRAMAGLDEAIRQGFSEAPLFARDTDLDALRSRPDFPGLEGRLWDGIFPVDPFAR